MTLVRTLCLLAVALLAGAARADTVAVEHVTVLPMSVGAAPLPDATVVIRDGRIVSVGPAAVPEDARRIDGSGKWLMPALTDMHVHVETVRTARGLFGPGIDANFVRARDVMTPYVANGVLQILNMSADPEAIAQRDTVERGDVVGPHVWLAAMVDGSPPLQPPVMTEVAATPADGRQIVRGMKWSGYDFVKAYGNLKPEVFDAILDEARTAEMKVVGHLGSGKFPAERYLRPGFAMVAHAEEFSRFGMDDADIPGFVALAQRNGTALTTTLALNEAILAQTDDIAWLNRVAGLPTLHPAMYPIWFDLNRYAPQKSPERLAELRRQVEFTRALTKAFVDAGIPVMAGSDTLVAGMAPGFALHDELEAMARAGLDNATVLAAATRVPAEWLGVAADRGTVEPGKRADLLLLDADPLADVANTRRIAAVIAGGRVLQRAELDAMMADLAARYAAMPRITLP